MNLSTGATEDAGNFLRVADLSADRLAETLTLAHRLKANRGLLAGSLSGRSMVCVFERPSTRTRLSLSIAARRLGLGVDIVTTDESQLSRGESVSDTGRVIGDYADLLAIRTFSHRRLMDFANASDAPVINALSDYHHPCQALADAMTLEEHFGALADVTIAFVGDAHGNIAHSLIELSALTGIHLRIAAPERFHPDPEVSRCSTTLARGRNSTVEIFCDPKEAVTSADVVYPEVWVPMAEDGDQQWRRDALATYRVDRDLMAHANPGALFMHCLPAYRGEEVTDEVIDGPQSVVRRQAENRLHTSGALIYGLLSPDHASRLGTALC